MKKFQNKYRIPSARAQWWDYGNDGAYFITICTAHRECYFGEVVNGEMKLSHVGVLADVFIHEIKQHIKNAVVEEYVIMPNHVHFILVLDGKDKNRKVESLESPAMNISCADTMVDKVAGVFSDETKGAISVETRHALSLQPNHTTVPPTNFGKRKNPRSKTISESRQKYNFVHSRFIQISGIKTCA